MTARRCRVELKLAEPRLRKDRNAAFCRHDRSRDSAADTRSTRRTSASFMSSWTIRFPGKPKHLTIIPPLDTQGKPVVNLGFIAYHKAVPDHRLPLPEPSAKR